MSSERPTVVNAPEIYVRMLEVLTPVSSCESRASRRRIIERHADLVIGDAARGEANIVGIG